ncbi:hypothetical protein FACS1894184_13960 [Clostridia bacterium]|nr:hypothetical protein FACS1894184_13960 [Clostridia bacterium]
MPLDTHTLRIDPQTQDLTFDSDGNMELIYDRETTAQCVRLTLLAYHGDFPLDTTHGTQWPRILGRKLSDLQDDEAAGILREAILQETEVRYVDSMSITRDDRVLGVEFDATLVDGDDLNLGVRMNAI